MSVFLKIQSIVDCFHLYCPRTILFLFIASSDNSEILNSNLDISDWPRVVAHACNPSTLGVQGGQITWGQEIETILANMVKPRLY